MSNNPISSPVAVIAINDSKLPIYQFSRTEHALPLAAIFDVLNLEAQGLPKNIQAWILPDTKKPSIDQYISVEDFAKLLVYLAQEGHHPTARNILKDLTAQGLQSFLSQSPEHPVDSTLDTLTATVSSPLKSHIELLPSALDFDYKSPEFSKKNDTPRSVPNLDQRYLDRVKARNQQLLSLLDEWDENPDYELDNSWDEVMTSL